MFRPYFVAQENTVPFEELRRCDIKVRAAEDIEKPPALTCGIGHSAGLKESKKPRRWGITRPGQVTHRSARIARANRQPRIRAKSFENASHFSIS